MRNTKKICFALIVAILTMLNPVGVLAEEHTNNEADMKGYDVSILTSVRLQQSEEHFDYIATGIDEDSDIIPCTPASANLGSVCVGSVCAGSICVGSACVGSACVGSACGSSGCGGSGCLGSICGGSACVASTCGGSACVSSVCGGSACVGSICGGSACLGSICASCRK